MYIPKEDIYLNQNDTIELYVIGYESMGESIVLNISNKFVGVVDCYKVKDYFITKQILESKGIKKLDFICWTHTDYDHTKGMLELFNYVNKETAFILPEGISCKELITKIDLKSERYCNKEIVSIFQAISHKIMGYNLVSANNSASIYNFNIKCTDDTKVVTVSIDSFAPLSSIVRENQISSIQQLIDNSKKLHEKPNLNSVGLIIKFIMNSNVLSICLTGDIDNLTIECMHPVNRRLIFGNNHIIKIPHHGSFNSDILINEKEIKFFRHAVSTSYKNHDLPKQDVLEGYKRCCSKGIISKTNNKKGPYGYVLYKIPIFKCFEQDTEVIYEGTAGEA